MNARLTKVTQSVDRLSLRERLFLLAAVLTVLAGAWEALLAAPLAAREEIAGKKIAALHERLDALNQSIAVTAEGISEGMPSQLDRLRALRARVAEGDEAVRVYTSDLVGPREMRLVLEELIRRQSGLRLLAATNLEPRPLFEDNDHTSDADKSAPAASGATGSSAPKLYRHSLVLRVEGSYLDCVEYLRAVERLPWHLYWARFELKAGDYPTNTYLIEVRTLSLDKEWIGV
jgi:MSHA biogenesis protein MshJ